MAHSFTVRRRWTKSLFWLVGACLAACGETNSGGNGNAGMNGNGSGGTAGTDRGVATATGSGTTGTGGAAAQVTNVMSVNTIGSTSGGVQSMHCHTLQEVEEAIESIGNGPIFGDGGQAGASPLTACPPYYPSLYGPPCGGELLPVSTEARCCYSFVNCN